MEHIKGILEKTLVKENISLPNDGRTERLSDLLPELKGVEGTEGLEYEILGYLDEIKKCEGCHKEGRLLEQCSKPYLDIDNGLYYGIAYGPCKRQQNYYMIKRAEKYFGGANIPERYKEVSFENFKVTAENEKVYSRCKRYAEIYPVKDNLGIIMYGNPGTGKTHLSLSILRTILQKGNAGVFVTVPELLYEIRQKMKSNSGENGELCNLVKTAPFLILDDLGAENLTEWVREQLFVFINARYNNLLPTVITTNCDEKELESRIGSRIYSRICEMCVDLQFDFADIRRLKH